MVRGNYCVIPVYDEFSKKILTLTYALNPLITIWILQRLIGQLNCHMIKTFAYFFISQYNTSYVTVTTDHGSTSTLIPFRKIYVHVETQFKNSKTWQIKFSNISEQTEYYNLFFLTIRSLWVAWKIGRSRIPRWSRTVWPTGSYWPCRTSRPDVRRSARTSRTTRSTWTTWFQPRRRLVRVLNIRIPDVKYFDNVN